MLTEKLALHLCLASLFIQTCVRSAELPRLQMNHGAWQLMVDGRPFLMRGGEFANNVFEAPKDLPGLAAMLDAYKGYALNTLLVPISWRSLEPVEGTFDFRMIDHLIEECRSRELRVVVLWFGAIKNGGLHYAPSWVIKDRERFFRAKRPDGRDVYAVSPFCQAAWEADRRAFIKLMERPRELLCFELDQTEPWDTQFKADFQGFSVTAQAMRRFGKLTGAGEEAVCETPGFGAAMKMDSDDFVVIGKTMRVSFERPGYRLKLWEQGHFRDNLWVGEQPQDVGPAARGVTLVLTDAPQALDLFRVKFEKQ